MDNIDILLKNNQPTTHARKSLSDTTMQVILQIKRVKLAQKILQLVLLIGIVLFIAKWFDNEIFYLIKIFFKNYSMVRGQIWLYTEAFIESLPKPQLLTVLLSSMLWLSWKRFETFLATVRITSKKTFLMTIIKMTPRLVLANTLFLSAILGFSGYSYAQNQEQKKLEILKQHINATGRVEFDTTCSSHNPQLTSMYEVKRHAKITNDDIPHVLAAKCYYDQSEEFAQELDLNQKYRIQHTADIKVGDITKEINIMDIYKITKSTPTSLELANTYNDTKIVIALDSGLTIYQGDQQVSRNALQEGVYIRPVTLSTNVITDVIHRNRGTGINQKRKDWKIIVAIILPKTPDIKWYHAAYLNQVTRITTCAGNPQDRCNISSSIDLFPAGGNEMSINPNYVGHMQQNNKLVFKEISGTITEFNTTTTKIKSSSGRIFTIMFESDPITAFNESRAQYYNKKTVGVGDTLLVRYVEEADKYETIIPNERIMDAVLLIEIINKTDDIQKY